jgi:hypothetical protein
MVEIYLQQRFIISRVRVTPEVNQNNSIDQPIVSANTQQSKSIDPPLVSRLSMPTLKNDAASPLVLPARCCLVRSCIQHGSCGQHAALPAPHFAVVLVRAVEVLERVS